MKHTPSAPRRGALSAPLALLLVLAGCAVGPDYQRPEIAVAESFHSAPDLDLARSAREPEAAWWDRLGDPVLSELIGRARDANLDLEEATARLDAARALLGAEKAERWPSGAVSGSVVEQKLSTVQTGGVIDASYTRWSAALDASWEIDLFGRVRRAVEARTARFEASRSDLRGVFVAVSGEIGRTYFELRGIQRRLQVARENADVQRQSLDIVRARVDAGRGTDLDTARATSQLESTRSRLPELEALEAMARHRLAVLVGEEPGSLGDLLAPVDALPPVPDRIAFGDPEGLLRRRPDVAAAERRLAAATAEVGIATADLFPRISLTGSFGALATSPEDLGDSDNRTSAYGPFLRWPLFDLGRIKARIRIAEADTDAALARYRQVVLRSLEEIENALVRWDRLRRRQVHLRTAADSAEEAVRLAHLRFEAGLSDFLVVLDAEARLLELQDTLARGDTEVGLAWVAIHQALGGGWEGGDPASASDVQG